ncbi:MAG: hypothetical protein ACYSWR_02425 [Planctomycetota bacterium]
MDKTASEEQKGDSKGPVHLKNKVRVMDKTNFEDMLNELVKEFGGMPDPQHQKLATLAKQAQESHKKLKKSVDSLQESLDYLRVCIKYQLFDLEATRRENTYLRKLLEDKDK